MATLLLTQLWINLVVTGDGFGSYHSAGDPDVAEMSGRSTMNSGGRQRTIVQEGVMGTWAVTLRQVSVANTELLRTWLGQTVLIRDHRGRRMYGTLLSVPRTPLKDLLDNYDVDLVLQLVTVDENVAAVSTGVGAFGFSPGVGIPKTATLVETWSTLDAKWTDNANASVVGGRLRMAIPAPGTGDAHVSTSSSKYDLTNSTLFVELSKRASDATGSQGLIAVVSTSPNSQVFIGAEAGKLLMRQVVAGTVSDDNSLTFDPWAHRYLRLRHDGTSVYWETSTNGTAWTTRRTSTPALDLTSITVMLQGTWWTTPAGASGRVEWGPVNKVANSPSNVFPPTSFGSLVTVSAAASSRWTSGLRQAMQEFAWDAYETADNTFSTAERDAKISQRGSLVSPGFRVTMGTGTHNAPSYLSGLANARLVNQAGTSSTGKIYDTVWNQLVRDKTERYFNRLNSEQGINNYNIIRLTSGVDAEALYPSGGWWAYSAGAQSGTNLPTTQRVCPYPGWHPGETTITTTQVQEWLEWYMDSLADVLNWQIRFFRGIGFTGWFEIVTPGLGTRINSIAAEVTGFLGTASSTTKVGAIFPWLYQRLIDRRGVVCYCSSVADLSGSGVNNLPDPADLSVDLASSTVLNWSAARHFVRIGDEFAMAKSGENPGWGGFGDTHTTYYNNTGTTDITLHMAYACRRFAILGKYMNFYWAHDDVLNGDVAGATFTATNYKNVVIDPTNSGTNPLTPTPPD